jgi:hypothetical protein
MGAKEFKLLWLKVTFVFFSKCPKLNTKVPKHSVPKFELLSAYKCLTCLQSVLILGQSALSHSKQGEGT